MRNANAIQSERLNGRISLPGISVLSHGISRYGASVMLALGVTFAGAIGLWFLWDGRDTPRAAVLYAGPTPLCHCSRQRDRPIYLGQPGYTVPI
jgi:hypothetical protein